MLRLPWAAVPEDLLAFLARYENDSPALVFRRPVIERNLALALAMAGDPKRLRPHVKTHKCAELVRLQLEAGIWKFKTATLAEAAMAAAAGAPDVLVAYPLVGPAAAAFADLRRRFPATRFSGLVDSERGLVDLSAAAAEDDPIDVWLDLDTGMGRTGLKPGTRDCVRVPGTVLKSRCLRIAGLHVYDGHRNESDPAERARALDRELEDVYRLREALGIPDLPICGGGTPSFMGWAAQRPEPIECSPGIFLLHDARYATRFPDLPFEPAALVLSRVVSSGAGRITLDCGSKALGPDCPAGDRAALIGVEGAREGAMSEEHWVWTVPGETPPVGTPVLLVPAHVCTTVAAHRRALILDTEGRVEARWPVLVER